MQEQHRKTRDGETSERDGKRKTDEGPWGQEQNAAEKKFHVSKKTLIIGGLVFGLLLIGGILYWLHARNFESTDDAYTTAHIHEISARVAGTVENVNVDDNQFVNGGQTLVVLDQRDFKVAVEQARALVLQRRAATDQAQANLVHAQQDYDRITTLGHEKVVSKQDLDNATATLKTANGAMGVATADLAAAKAALSNAELQLSYTTIAAPTSGVIGKKTVETGAHILPAQALMAVVERDVWGWEILRKRNSRECEWVNMSTSPSTRCRIANSAPMSIACSRERERSSPCCLRITPPGTSPRSCSVFR